MLLNNAIGYFRKVRYSRYILVTDIFMRKSVPRANNDNASTSGGINQKRKCDETVEGEE